nr:ribonuclease H-like domain-containing protein [Tanacetum cinerariifolium]
MTGDDNHNGDHLETSNPSPPVPPPNITNPSYCFIHQTPYPEKREYDILAMKMEQYLSHTDYPICTTASSLNIQNVAFVSADNTSSTNDGILLETIELKGTKTAEEEKLEDIDWSGHVEEDAQNYAMMAYSSSNSGSDNESVFINKERNLEDTPINDRYAAGIHAVPPYMTGNYMPSGPDVEIDYSKFTYSKKQTSVDESDSRPSEYASCESDSSVDTTTSMHEPVESEPKVVCEPKVWTDAPIIEKYGSDSDSDSMSNVQEEKEKPSFVFTDSVKHVKASRKNVKETGTPNHSPKVKKQNRNGHTRKGLGYTFTRKACFVCRSFSHLIRDCDFHEKRMAKQAELTKRKNKDDPYKALKDKGIVDSGCFRHMTGNKAHLADYQEFKGGYVAFGSRNGRITGKGKIKPSRLDFENVYYVEELKHYNLFFMSHMCDKKNKVLFTDTNCLMLSPDFKLPNENQVLLKIPRQHNMYSFNLKNIDPSRDLACLFAKASIDKSNKWHRRLGHVNFKNLNKLVKGNLVRGLPFKIFEKILVLLVKKESNTRPLVRPRQFSWVYFLKSKDETTPILKDFIRQAENQFNHKAEAVNTACYVLNMVLVTKPQNNTFYELLTGKFDRKSDSGFLVGYFLNSKAFKVYNLETKRVEENLHVNFLENKPNVVGKEHAWMFDLDYLTYYMNYEPVSVENQANKSAGLKEVNNSAGTQANDDQSANSEENDLQKENFVLPIWSAYSTTVKSSGDKIEEKTDIKSCEKPDAHTNNTNLLNTVSTPLSVVGPSRAFNDGELSYPDDPSMPHLEDIYASPSEGIFTDSFYDDEGVTKSKVNKNSKTHALVSYIQKQQRNNHKDFQLVCLLVYYLKLNPKRSLKYWKIKVGLMLCKKNSCSSKFRRQEERIDYDKVFAPVARIEAIRIFLAFASYMGFIVYQMDVKSAFLYGTIDEEVYVTQPPGFVDPWSPNKVYKVVKALYGLHQAPRAFVKTTSTPIKTQKPLVKDEESADVDVSQRPTKIGSLVSKVSSFDLEAYSDSDYAGANLDRKSITEGCQFLGRGLISWQCKKQTIVATSTTKAEYVAAAHYYGQVLWIQNQLLDYGFNIMNTKIYIDNESTICIVKNPVFHSKTKHIEIRHNFIRDAYEKKLIQVLKIHIDDNVADLLTKAFDVSRFNFLVVNIGLLNL